MMRLRVLAIVLASVLVAVLAQTTLFGQLRLITPDLVMLVVILLALTRIRPEATLGVAFGSGLVVDLLGSSLLGLRAVVFTIVAYVAVKTRERAEIGRIATALWAGLLTFSGVVLLLLIGILFGQTALVGDQVTTRMVAVPVANLVLASLLAPWYVRIIDRDATSYRFS